MPILINGALENSTLQNILINLTIPTLIKPNFDIIPSFFKANSHVVNP